MGSERAPDIVLVVVRDEEAFSTHDNPYLATKAFLLAQGIPSQEVRLSVVREKPSRLPYILENIAVAIYAKLGGAPWTIRPSLPLTKEVVVGMAHAQSLDEARRWLSAFGVKRGLWAAYPSTFSGGEQQKVNLARARILPRRLLFLDEPTASLDRNARRALVARHAELKTAGVAMIGVFHHPDDVADLIDREINLETRTIADGADDVAE